MRLLHLAAEAVRVARSQPVSSTVTILVVGAVCAVILSTTGQTVQAERRVLARIDEAGTRSIVVTDIQGGAGLTPAGVEHIRALSLTEWVIGLGTAADVRPAAVPGGPPAGSRTLYGQTPPPLHMTAWDRAPGTLLVGTEAQATLGLRVPAGGVVTSDGAGLAVVGSFTADEPLAFLERSALVAPDPDDPAPTVRVIHVSARRPEDVAALAPAIRSVLGAADPAQVSVETSARLAEIRATIAGELGTYGRSLVLMVLGAGLALVALTMYGAVTARRRDFGRRRALGASRSAIISLVTLQTVITGTLGATLGTIAGAAIAWRLTGDLLTLGFAAAVATLAVLATLVAAIPPAVIAAHRDPIRVLRVP